MTRQKPIKNQGVDMEEKMMEITVQSNKGWKGSVIVNQDSVSLVEKVVRALKGKVLEKKLV